jgi:hypothetical protein
MMNPEDLKNWAARNAAQGPVGEDFGAGGGGEPDGDEGGGEPAPTVTGEALLTLSADMATMADRIDALLKADTDTDVDIGKLGKAVEDFRAHAEEASALSDELISEEELAASAADESGDGND